MKHMCCGYPGNLNDTGYHKADPQSYLQLAEAISRSSVDQISIEDAHRHNDLSLLERFAQSTVILDSVAIAQSQVEAVDEIALRLIAGWRH